MPRETRPGFPTTRRIPCTALFRSQKANTPARCGWNADRAQPFLVIAARDASSISDDRQKSGQVLVRTEPIIQMILGRFRGGMSGVLKFCRVIMAFLRKVRTCAGQLASQSQFIES